MALEIVTSWQTLFQKAGAVGKAKMAYKEHQSRENKAKMDAAVAGHNEYRDMCLKADRMIGLEGLEL